MNDVRWAIVGTGDVSHAIAPDFTRADGATLTAICSRSHDRAIGFAAQHAVERVFAGFEELIGDPEIDALYIATPHGTHHAIVTAAIESGKHVLIEKPIALDAIQAADIFRRAAADDVLAVEAMWTVFGPTFTALNAAIAEGVIGEVRSVRASFGVPFPRGVGSRWSVELGGSTLLDQGIYPVTLANAFLGVPEETTARAVFENGVDVTTWITQGYAGGRFAQLSASCVEYADLSASINGTTGWITLDAPFWAGTGFTVHQLGAGPTGDHHEFEREGGGFVPMIEAVSAAIQNGSLSVAEHTPADSLAVFAQLDEIRRRW